MGAIYFLVGSPGTEFELFGKALNIVVQVAANCFLLVREITLKSSQVMVHMKFRILTTLCLEFLPRVPSPLGTEYILVTAVFYLY